MSEQEGVAVEVLLRGEGEPIGWLHIESVELVECDEGTSIAPPETRPRDKLASDRHQASRWAERTRQLLDQLSALIIVSRARADHGTIPGSYLGEPQLVWFGRGDSYLGTLVPFTGSFCSLEVAVTPARLASRGVREASEAGFSLVLSDRTGERRPIRAFASGVWVLPFSEPLVLSPENRTHVLRIDLSPAWPDNPASASETQLGFAAFEVIASSAQARRLGAR